MVFNCLDSGFGSCPFFFVGDDNLSVQRLPELAGVPVCARVLPEMHSPVLGRSRHSASDRSFKQELN